MGTWLVVKQAHDIMKKNRALLGKKKTARELYREEIESRPTTLDGVTLESVRERVEERIRRNRVHVVATKLAATSFIVLLVMALVWMVMLFFETLGPKEVRGRLVNEKLFFSQLRFESDATAVRTEFFPHGPMAARHHLVHGLKDGLSESYYETGELFRSALYRNDTVLIETYFFKSNDTIKSFPAIRDIQVYTIRLKDPIRKSEISFDFYDGKIIAGTYIEAPPKEED